MNELLLFTFEKQIVDLCNGVAIPNRAKYYILKDIADRLLKVSDTDVKKCLEEIEKSKEKGETVNE